MRKRSTPILSHPSLPHSYHIGQNLNEFHIPFNGAGWDKQTGAAAVSVILFVTNPRYLEVDLGPAPGRAISELAVKRIRAKVGLEFLERESITPLTEGWRVRFKGPRQHRYQQGLQPVFLALVSPDHLADETSPFILKRVAWREEQP